MPSKTASKVRRTQEERSAATRKKLLEATIECLVELGYAGTTTTGVAQRAGLSRGAQLHHFPTKAELVAAAVEHLAHRLAEDYRDRVARIPGKADRASATIDILWEAVQGPLFTASLELIVAARTDEALRDVLKRFHEVIRSEMATSFRELFGDGEYGRRLWLAFELSIALTNGFALERSVRGRRGIERLLAEWKTIVTPLFDDVG